MGKDDSGRVNVDGWRYGGSWSGSPATFIRLIPACNINIRIWSYSLSISTYIQHFLNNVLKRLIIQLFGELCIFLHDP